MSDNIEIGSGERTTIGQFAARISAMAHDNLPKKLYNEALRIKLSVTALTSTAAVEYFEDAVHSYWGILIDAETRLHEYAGISNPRITGKKSSVEQLDMDFPRRPEPVYQDRSDFLMTKAEFLQQYGETYDSLHSFTKAHFHLCNAIEFAEVPMIKTIFKGMDWIRAANDNAYENNPELFGGAFAHMQFRRLADVVEGNLRADALLAQRLELTARNPLVAQLPRFATAHL